ncbi:hypothetical protein K445DRAFT_168938 [Daldinia sp. EC12]|nr:hypothetical protein K445DRAFT_168938 [Daldinia sp. EC12]
MLSCYSTGTHMAVGFKMIRNSSFSSGVWSPYRQIRKHQSVCIAYVRWRYRGGEKEVREADEERSLSDFQIFRLPENPLLRNIERGTHTSTTSKLQGCYNFLFFRIRHALPVITSRAMILKTLRNCARSFKTRCPHASGSPLGMASSSHRHVLSLFLAMTKFQGHRSRNSVIGCTPLNGVRHNAKTPLHETTSAQGCRRNSSLSLVVGPNASNFLLEGLGGVLCICMYVCALWATMYIPMKR